MKTVSNWEQEHKTCIGPILLLLTYVYKDTFNVVLEVYQCVSRVTVTVRAYALIYQENQRNILFNMRVSDIDKIANYKIYGVWQHIVQRISKHVVNKQP